MDIVIPLGNGSRHQNLELRYCLRSVEKYVPSRQNVFIVGEKPPFLKNVIHIRAMDISGKEYKERNIFSKILIACNDKRVSEDFLFMNDDHFLLQPWDNRNFHYKCSLRESLDTRKVNDEYYRSIANTLAMLGRGNNFDTHCPIVFNKQKFKDTVATAGWHVNAGFLIKSLYCNMNGIEGTFYRDLKLSKPFSESELKTLINRRLYFSCADFAITPIFEYFLQELYPNPSRYES